VRGFPHQFTQGRIAINDLKTHASQINILSSQAYHINEKGVVFGSLNPQMIEIVKAAHIKIMPLVGNTNFDRNLAHIFLNDTTGQNLAIQNILQLCKQNNFAGIQIDFEGMSFLDRDAFTNFYQKIANILHQNGFQVAIALVPMLTENVPANDYLKGRYIGWSGIYDYKELSKNSDFVTLIAYDQHGGITTPGPMAGITWDEAIVQYALKYTPPEKISLGIPWHSGYWYTGKNAPVEGLPNSNAADNPLHAIAVTLSYSDMMRVFNDNHVALRWDDEDKSKSAV
jgi:spore germination protein YaaH